MATKKISELQELETLNNNDLIPVVDIENESTKKVTFRTLGTASSMPTGSIIGYDSDTIPGGYEEATDYDTGWQTPTLNTEVFETSGVRYRRIGKVVYLEGVVKPLASTAAGDRTIQVLSNLPEPLYTVQYSTILVSTSNMALRMAVTYTGELLVFWNAQGTTLTVNDIPIHIAYVID